VVELLDARDAADHARWIEIWSQWPNREAQAHPAYLELFAGPEDRPRAAVLSSSRGSVLYPFLQRPIGEVSDLTSPYGYGGAYAWGGDRDSLAGAFWPAFDAWAKSAGVVAEFMRVAVGTDDTLPYVGELVRRQDNVIVPTAHAPTELWTSYAHKVRKNVNKARAANVRVVFDLTGERLDAFARIYLATMSRRSASQSYRFEAAFFQRLNATLPQGVAYFHAVLDGEVISTELALVSAQRIYSFLGGTDERFFDLRPNDLLKHEMIEWAHANGKSQFVLGGGFQPDDGIFQYKKAFAPDGVVPFYTGQRILDPDRYEHLVADRRASVGGPLAAEFFPAYRAPAAEASS
jgi:hypothetical protein